MRALVYLEKGKLAVQYVEKPAILHDADCIVRVTYASICNSDLHIRDGFVPKAKPGTTLGHEYVGIIESVGKNVHKFRPGDHVAASCLTICGDCWFCKQKFYNNCENGGWKIGCSENGGLAEFVRVMHADRSLSLIPPALPDLSCLFVGDILATGYFGAQMCEILPGQEVCVIGAGSCGLCTAMCCKNIFEAEVTIVETSKDRIEFARELNFAEVMTPESAISAFESITKHNGFDAVIECAGSDDTLALAIELARCHGIVGIVAMYEKPELLDLVNYYGKNLTFKTGGVDAGYDDYLIEQIQQGTINCDWMVGKVYKFDDIMEALHDFELRKYLKVVVSFE